MSFKKFTFDNLKKKNTEALLLKYTFTYMLFTSSANVAVITGVIYKNQML